jgi:HAMP domain-containing protein
VRDPALKEWSEVRETSSGRNVVVAQPLRVASSDCLNCHSVPERAPKTMVEAYGPEHGFGWQLGQVIGAQVVTVPMSIPEQRAATVFHGLMLTLVGVFAGLLIALNLLVHLVITSRVRRMSRIAELVSRGKSDSENFVAEGTDELSMLERSFNRMRNSLASAMKMLEP